MKRLFAAVGLALMGLMVHWAYPTLPGTVASEKGTRIRSWIWTGDALAYPDPAPGEDTTSLGEVYRVWFSKAGPAKRGDTFPMTWGDDDAIYTSSGDPHWGAKETGLDIEKFLGAPPHYEIIKVNEMKDYVGNGGAGPKPTGMICVDGVLYLAFQNLLGKKSPEYGAKSQHGSDAVIVRSKDHGRTWEPKIKDLAQPMFPGSAFGGPAFINCGKDNQDARDGFVYAVSADQWDNGSKLRLGRVPKDRILDPSAWHFVAGRDLGRSPRWSARLEDAVPVLTRDRMISLPDMVFLSSIKRYLLLTWALKRDFSPEHGSTLFVYEAPEPWGPFTLVHEEPWEDAQTTPYCPRIPLKWLAQSGSGISGWLQFSGSWRENSSHYRSHVRPFRLLLNR